MGSPPRVDSRSHAPLSHPAQLQWSSTDVGRVGRIVLRIAGTLRLARCAVAAVNLLECLVQKQLAWLLISAVLVLAACGGEDPTTTRTPTNTEPEAQAD